MQHEVTFGSTRLAVATCQSTTEAMTHRECFKAAMLLCHASMHLVR
jgi:hypothetical protein